METSPYFFTLPPQSQALIFSFLDLPSLLDFTLVSKPFKSSLESAVKSRFEKTFRTRCSAECGREVWEALFRFRSKKPRVVFGLLHWAVERDYVAAVERILDRLFVLILSIEVIKHTSNQLISIDIQHILARLEGMNDGRGQDAILNELTRSERLRHSIFGCLINCSLHEYRDMSPFYVCCSLGRKLIFDYMRRFEPNVSTKDVTRTLCIHAAIRSCNERIVEELLVMNANCTAPNKLGETPLMCACAKRMEKVAMLLIERLNSTNSLENQKALSLAAQHGLAEVLARLIGKGVNINNTAYYNKTPLMYAAESNELEALRALLRSGADLNQASDDGVTALTHAVKLGHLDIVRELLASGADVLGHSIESSAFAAAALGENIPEMLELLLQFHWLTPFEASRLLARSGKNASAEFKTAISRLARGPAVGNISGDQQKPEKISREAKVRKKVLENVVRPISAAVVPTHQADSLFPTCEGRKVGVRSPRNKRDGKKKGSFTSRGTADFGFLTSRGKSIATLAEAGEEMRTVKNPKSTRKKKTRPAGSSRKIGQKRGGVKTLQVQNLGSSAEEVLTSERDKEENMVIEDLYFDYLSPEKGCREGLIEEYKKFAEQQQTTLTPMKPITAGVGLTPGHKLLFVSPEKLMLAAEQRNPKSVDGDRKKKRKVNKAHATTTAKHGNNSNRRRSQRHPADLIRKKRPLSCKPRLDPAKRSPAPRKRLSSTHVRPSSARAKTVLTKYFSGNGVKYRPNVKCGEEQSNSQDSSLDYLCEPKIPATIEEMGCEDSEDKSPAQMFSNRARKRQPMKLRYTTLAESYKQIRPPRCKKVNASTGTKTTHVLDYGASGPKRQVGNSNASPRGTLLNITPSVRKLCGPIQTLRQRPESAVQRVQKEMKFAELLARQFQLTASVLRAERSTYPQYPSPHMMASTSLWPQPLLLAQKTCKPLQLSNLLSTISTSTRSLHTLAYAKGKFFTTHEAKVLTPKVRISSRSHHKRPPLLMVTNSLSKLPPNHNRNMY